MQAKPESARINLFSTPLERIINQAHPLRRLADTIDWAGFDKSFGELYNSGMGRPAKPTRLMVGLHYIKQAFDLSDEEVVLPWVENPYWQYFCGVKSFQHEFPIDPGLMTKWRKRVASKGMEKLLEETIKVGFKTGTVKRASVKKLNNQAEGRLGRNYLLGKEGDKMNVILCGAGHNMRKLLAAFLFFIFGWSFQKDLLPET